MDGRLLVHLDFVWQNFLNRLGFNNCIWMTSKFLFVSLMTLRGHDKSTIGNVMGRNFFRLWQKVAD